MLRMSTLFVRTLREDPADAEIRSHRLLVRAGYIRRAAPGGFSWLPLGKLVLDRVTRVVKEEMAAIGAQEVLFPALIPRDVYDATGRTDEFDLFAIKDRSLVLAPTHEELFTLLVRDVLASYKDFPVILFQTQWKFRDEPRPRAGLLRAREFLMKDSYSFDLDDDGLDRSYRLHREAYQRIFERLGLPVVPVSAMAGAMGGSRSEEFLLPIDAGEDTFASCAACGYAANIEAVAVPAPTPAAAEHGPLTVLDTPDTPTIETLVDRLNQLRTSGRVDWAAADTLKNVVVRVEAPGREPELLAIGVPGDREVDLKRVEAALHPARVTMFDDFASRPDLVKGYIGPQDIKLRYLVDPRVAPGTAWVTGANEAGKHAADVVCGRDFAPDGTIDAADVRAGDPCPTCAGPLALRRGVELGHIFQLGRRYADVFGLDALGPDSKPIRITMGSYGIGISRLVGALAEVYSDEHGLAWPKSAAPVDVHLLVLGKNKLDAAAALAAELERAGLRVLLDDRPGLSAGVRFADAELIGAPATVVVGRGFDQGDVEVRDRASGRRAEVPVARLVADLTG
ncbi:proline--tRNA ligase [Virgisporangium aurantiacum]|uniref:Proline--tRNA ligase n=1 Tax=Virgisporangium aurantiacum TaxID=175570 RepID=A0A8J3Z933_9ACTN|nr:proline--tRNA ligase [Virgisporangium aurantiacum]GIJ59641.1 proline--tRNA ligase [Virgisporangium aurantiacum]